MLVDTRVQVGAQKLAMQLDYNGWLSTKCSHTSTTTAASSSSNISSSNLSGVVRTSAVETGYSHSGNRSASLSSELYTIRRPSQSSAALR